MGVGKSQVVPEADNSCGCEPAASRRKKMSIFQIAEDVVKVGGGKNIRLTIPPEMSIETEKFLLKTLSDLFCLREQGGISLQAALLLDALQYCTCKEGDLLMEEGTTGREMFIVENGDLEIVIGGTTIRHLRRGAVIGELAVLYDAPRSATVKCLTSCSFYVLTRKDFKNIQEITTSNNLTKRSEWLQNCPHFSALDSMDIHRILHSLQTIELKRGDKIYERGVMSNRIIIVESGTVRIDDPDKDLTTKDHVDKVQAFAFRSSSVLADYEAIELIQEKLPDIAQNGFLSQKYTSLKLDPALQGHGLIESEMPLSPTTTISCDLNSPAIAPPQHTSNRNTLPKEESFEFGSSDIDLGPGNVLGMCIILSKANMLDNAQIGWEWMETTTINELGESKKKAGAVSPFDVVVSSDTASCLFFTVDNLEEIFGPCAVFMAELKLCNDENRKYIFRKGQRDESAKMLFQNQHFDSSKFEQLCFIKDGAFGYSALVRYVPNTGNGIKIYNINRYSKAKVAEKSSANRVLEEIKILSQMNSPFVATLAGVCPTMDEVILVYETMGVSDLWSYIYEYNGGGKEFDMTNIKYLLASIIHGLAHIHSCGVTYRELKPEHIAMDNLGRIKLNDFSSAKRIPFTTVSPTGQLKIHTKSFTFCGTPEYLAPEVILSNGADQAVDIWALGVIAYELLMHSTPFVAEDGTQIFANIAAVTKKAFVSPPEFIRKSGKSNLRELVDKLLKAQPACRLSCAERQTEKILQHAFFKSFDVDSVKASDYSLPGYNELNANHILISNSYNGYMPDVLPYRGGDDVWSAFDIM